jgi:CheY-like chemotaxis protein
LEGDGISVVYATDHEPHSRRLALGGEGPPVGEDERHARFLEDADLVIHDAQYTAEEYPAKTGWGHSTMEFVVDTARYAGARRLALFHHDPMRDDDSVDRLVSLARERATSTGGGVEVFAAAEGKVLELERPSKRGIRAGVGSEPAMTNVLSAVCAQSVLIASPDATAVSTLCDAVRADGLRLLLADDGDQALALVRAETPSLVVLDEAVLGRTALEVCRGIRELGDDAYRKDVAIVLMKAAEEPAAREEECAAGVTDWLLKPFDNVYARARVQAWLLRTACRWVRAPRPPDEERRMNSLQRLEILDTEPEERFDRYTRIASALFHMPIALVSLVDTNRQWFKSRIGLGATETPRDRAFCAHAILDDDVLQVRDAVQDSRFADNPLVIEEPRVRFYAGAPLKLTDGSRAGTLCLIDRRPRDLDERQLGLLRDLAMLVAGELERNAKP